MRGIAVDQIMGEVYSQAGNYWRILLPPPLVTGAVLDPKLPTDLASLREMPLMFREDHFDPTSRIRRGRLYEASPGQRPSPQRVLPRLGGDSIGGNFEKSLFVYIDYQLLPSAVPPKLVALGSPDFISLWQVAAPPERISTGEFLFILKARHGFGIIPEIEHALVPEKGRAKVVETLGTLADAAHREAPGSIIDRARDATQYCLATWATAVTGEQLLGVDLGPLLKKVPRHAKETACAAAEVVRLLHARNKPNVQEQFGARPPMEDDAELAIKAVACIVRDLGWALG